MTLLEATGVYAHERYSGRASRGCLFGPAYRRSVIGNGRQWRTTMEVPAAVERAWRRLSQSNRELETGTEGSPFWDDVMRLAATADEAAEGVGFAAPPGLSVVADLVIAGYAAASARRRAWLPELPHSLCYLVPASEACVQPKTRTSQVGCTTRCTLSLVGTCLGTRTIGGTDR